jgi:amino acid adenylation domain-containing protein
MNEDVFDDKIPHLFFERQVDVGSHRVAVFTENQTLTYGELNRKANQLAHYLKSLNIQQGEPVGVCTTHEPERVLALAAIAKAGGVYVPIDPFYPSDLINYMTDKVNARFILTNRMEIRERSFELNATVVDLEVLIFSNYSIYNLPLAVASSDPIYIIFTSGSTGHPKAVAVSHRAAWNHFAWVMDYTHFGSSDIWLQTINPSFDPSMHELMAPLMIGGRIALIGGTRRLDSREIADAIIRHSATHITTVPTMLTLLVNTPNFSSCGSLKEICVGGEVFRPALAKEAYAKLPNTVFHNVYGPTEATIMASGWPIIRPEEREALPIGPAIYNMKFYLRLDSGEIAELRPGLEGELCISGVSLANGYVNDEAKTNEVFLDNPHDSHPKSIYRKIYLAGDRCRIDETGNLYCLGRLDGQVKINGQRVELAEVEYQFSTLPNVRDVAVFKIDADLVAGIVPHVPLSDEKAWLASVQERIQKKLPQFMVPKRMVILDVIPGQTVSAKADRKKVQEILTEKMRVAKDISEVKSDNVQEKIFGMIEAVVNVSLQEGDMDTSFADLGLDSVNMQMLTLKVNQQFGCDLRTEMLFEYYTIAKLAAFIEDQTLCYKD